MKVKTTNEKHTTRNMKRTIVLPLLALALTASAQDKTLSLDKTIKQVAPVNVTTTAGTAPTLPYRLWVDYSDGLGEYRQVKWMNYSLTTEQREADATLTPAGSHYDIQGYIVGDNSTSVGYPILAHVTVTATAAAVPAPQPVAEPLPLEDVRLIGHNRLTHNRDLDIDNLLSLDPRQQVYNYRDTYGLPTDGYPVSDGWDSPTTKLKGHGTGHYLSAMAMAYASCTDKQKKAQLKKNIKYVIDEMRRCQERTFVFDKQLGRYREARDLAPEDTLLHMGGTWADFDRYKHDYAHYGYGYMNAIPAEHCALIERYAPYNNEEGVWAPYYTVHKQLAGLIDVALHVDDKKISEKALTIARDMGLWVWNRLHYRTYLKTDGTQAERRARPGNRYEMWNMYIAGEVGGMQESLSRLSEMVSDPTQKARLIEAASYFNAPAFYDPLSHNIDAIRDRHANQHIPMIVGALRSYRSNHNPYYWHIADNFWNFIQGRYRYAMGGVGNGEMFRQPYKQMVSLATNPAGPDINETCCAYNLAKLTKDLNGYHPNDARYMDYYERVLSNQLVGSINPRHYAVLYQYAVGLDANKPWGNETPQSTCCGGTGAENHVKYQEAAYFVGADTLWVGLYLPTEATWRAKKVTLEQQCQWPAERTVLRITRGKASFTMKLRVPYWATEGFRVSLNGQPLDLHCQPGTYVTLPERRWAKGDSVVIDMPFAPHLDFTPDKMDITRRQTYKPLWTAAFMRGPLVLAARDIHTWDEATLHTAADAGRLAFVPDYDADTHITHYFRLDRPVADTTYVDTTTLTELMTMARQRLEAQQAWDSMEVKVPEFAPWAKNGIEAMRAKYDAARRFVASHQGNAATVVSELNAALSMMRPGNLAEPADLKELNELMQKARQMEPTPRLKDAIEYGEMVQAYVNDGSGTKDFIRRAVTGLQAAMKK